MKFIIFSFLMVILVATESHGQLTAFACRGTPLNTVGMNCPKAVPAKALHKLFEKNFPDISFQKTTYDDGDGYTVFGTVEHAYYLKTSKDNKIIGLEQGLEKSACHYKYKITDIDGKRYCSAKPPKESGISCLQIHASDPIRNPNNKRRDCEAFLEAMLSCSKDSKSTEKCKKELYGFMNKDDKSNRPIPNIANKPAPEYDNEFEGEPDVKPRRSGAGGSK